jgi:hypothetical protein
VNEFLVTGIDARVTFHVPSRPSPPDHHINNILQQSRESISMGCGNHFESGTEMRPSVVSTSNMMATSFT